MSNGLRSAMSFVFPSEKIFDIERLALACIERANALVYLGAQVTQLLDMREELAANLFLIRVRQIGDLRDRYFKCPYHSEIISQCGGCLHQGLSQEFDNWRAHRSLALGAKPTAALFPALCRARRRIRHSR